MYYMDRRPIDGKLRRVIVDKTGKTVNRNPSKEELKLLAVFPKENYKRPFKSRSKKYINEELLDELRRFEKEHRRSPVVRDFVNNPEYPNFGTYVQRFGSWQKALKLVGLDVDSMIKQGVIQNEYQKGRLTEILVRDHFKIPPIDLSGEQYHSTYDAICPNGMSYDVKSSKLYNGMYYTFGTKNKDKDDDKEAIQWYYFLALNNDGSIKYARRVPGEIVEKDHFYVGLNSNYEFNVENMKEYDITELLKLSTDKFKEIFKELF